MSRVVSRDGGGECQHLLVFFGLLLAFHGEGGRYGGLCKVVLVQHEHETGFCFCSQNVFISIARRYRYIPSVVGSNLLHRLCVYEMEGSELLALNSWTAVLRDHCWQPEQAGWPSQI
jgi:hypothetical protein